MIDHFSFVDMVCIDGKKNVRIFEDKWRIPETIRDLSHFYSSLWPYCTTTFKDIPLIVVQLN